MSPYRTTPTGPVFRVQWEGKPPFRILAMDSGVEALGYTADEFVSGAREWADYIHPDDLTRERPAYREAMARRQDDGTALAFYRFRAADGSWRELASINVIDRDTSGEVITVWSIVMEDAAFAEAVRRMRESDRRLREDNDRLAVIMNRTPTPIALLDHRHGVVWCNEAFAVRTGFAPNDLMGRDVLHLLACDDADAVLLGELRHATASGGQFRGELPWRDAKGEKFWADTTHQAIPPTGAWRGGSVFTLRDVSARREAERALAEREAQLQQLQKMEAVGRLASSVAHDFNNLLQVVGSAVEVMQAGLPPDHPLQRQATLAKTAAQKAADVTRQLLLVGRPSRGQSVLADTRHVLADMRDVMRQALGPDVLLYETIATYPLYVRLDVTQFEQVLMNLIVNARDAVGASGPVWLALARVVLADSAAAGRQVAPGAYVELVVRDGGGGMSPEVAARAFEPFFSTKRDKRAGLGLATVFGIARHNGGYVQLNSLEGRGTTVTVGFPEAVALDAGPDVMPTSAPVVAGANASRANGPAANSEWVLVVEDFALVAAAVTQGLTAAGFRVTSVGSAHDALHLLRHSPRPPDLLLTDVHLPDMRGEALADQARSLVAHLPVVLMSGADDGVENRSPALRKPFTTTALVTAVRDAIARGP